MYLVPIPLTVFRSNSKFDQNLQCSGSKRTVPIVLYHYEILYTLQQCYCRYMCNISLRWTGYVMDKSIAKFHWISNSIEIPLVGRAPGIGWEWRYSVDAKRLKLHISNWKGIILFETPSQQLGESIILLKKSPCHNILKQTMVCLGLNPLKAVICNMTVWWYFI